MSDFEVWVSEHGITEISRGQHVTVAQTHGQDWSAPPVVRTHQEAMLPPASPVLRAISDPVSRHNGLFTFLAIAIAIAASWLILSLR